MPGLDYTRPNLQGSSALASPQSLKPALPSVAAGRGQAIGHEGLAFAALQTP